jgi:hypothetical protein
LPGVWELFSYEVEFQDTGECKKTFGDAPKGRLVILSSGRVMAVITAADRCLPTSDSDRAAAFQSMVAYSGSFRVDGNEWITDVDMYWHEDWTNTVQRRYFKLDGDSLDVSSAWAESPHYSGRITRGLLTWRRVGDSN